MIQRISEDRLWNQIAARAWCDDAVMKRLRADPRTVLAEYSLAVPEDTEIKLTEGTDVQLMVEPDRVWHFILPFSPPDELMDEDLVGGAVAWCGCASAACARCVACAACGRCGRCGCRCW